ncbi:MAG: TldD/PmbA family protein, partial [Bryobacteraceae bacterium]
HRDGIEAVVDHAIAITKASEPDPDLQPLYEDRAELNGSRFSESIARCSPAERARSVAEAIRIVEGASQTAAGIYSTAQAVESVRNSRGLFRYYVETMAQFSITAMAGDSSGWAKASSSDPAGVVPAALAERASRKAVLSMNPKSVQARPSTVILEPAAVLDLTGQMFGDFSATALADKRSFLTGRLGEKLFGENISIYDHVDCPLQTGPPFDGEGVPRKPLTLVERGVTKDVAWSRARAFRACKEPTGHGFPLPNEHGEAPHNIVMAGGKHSIEDLIASTADGILVTRLWYIREVEPFDKVMTGMTRDGTFLIRDGQLICGLRNLRFNQSLVEMLRNVEMMSESVRASGEEAIDMVVPGMKVHDFQFTEVTRF